MTPDESDAIKQLAEKIQVLDLREGDVLVVYSPIRLGDAVIEGMKRSLSEILNVPHNKILILDEGIELQIIRAEALKGLAIGGYQPQAQHGNPLPPPKEE